MPHQMQDAIGFSHRLCSIIFPFMIIECVVFFNARKRFFHKNATVLTVIIKIKIFMH